MVCVDNVGEFAVRVVDVGYGLCVVDCTCEMPVCFDGCDGHVPCECLVTVFFGAEPQVAGDPEMGDVNVRLA